VFEGGGRSENRSRIAAGGDVIAREHEERAEALASAERELLVDVEKGADGRGRGPTLTAIRGPERLLDRREVPRDLCEIQGGFYSRPVYLTDRAFLEGVTSAAFVDLASALVQAMGQRLDAGKPIPDGLALRTEDGFLYAFLEDPAQVSLEDVRNLFGEEAGVPIHLVILTPHHLPLAIAEEAVRRGATLVEGPRFTELARQLGLETLLGEGPRAVRPDVRRLLPSAQQLDAIMHRARSWLDWGVPALGLRFYRQAADLKPGFLPARIGIARSLLALGLTDDADRAFDEILRLRPDDLDARLGKAAVLGAKARPKEEVEVYRSLLAEDEARTEVRAHLVAALVDLGDWASARVEIEAMLARTPEDPQIRFLHAVALEKTGANVKGRSEREEARRLGLTYEREAALCQHLGLPPPPPPAEAPATPPARTARRTVAGAAVRRAARSKSTKLPAPATRTKTATGSAATRKRK